MITPTPHNALADRRSPHGYAVRDDAAEVSGLRATIELAPVGIAQFDTRGRFLLVNSRLCTILGYSHAELLAMTFHDITFPE
ncbi:MAG: PAS domain S-box protein, partial [Longimicrobiales bacterium]